MKDFWFDPGLDESGLRNNNVKTNQKLTNRVLLKTNVDRFSDV